MTTALPRTAVQRWERATGPGLTAAALLFLAAYAVPIIWLGVPAWLRTVCDVISWATWVLFALDYVARLALAEDKLAHVRRHWLDLLVIVLPLLRPLRLLRLVSLLDVLNRQATRGLRGQLVTYVVGGSLLLAFCAALAVLDAERAHPQANIVDLDDAAWWAITTMSSVGYGDRYPVTGPGRLVAALLMLGGVALLGVVTATLASYLVERISAQNDDERDALRAEVALLRRELAGSGATPSPPGGAEFEGRGLAPPAPGAEEPRSPGSRR